MSVNERVTQSLFQFLRSHVTQLKLEDIDDIVLSYVVSILQDLSESNYELDEDEFDVDAFCEMLVAYLPETSCIPPEEVTGWMFQMVKEQKELQRRDTKLRLDLKSVIDQTAKTVERTPKSSESSSDGGEFKKRTTRYSENSDSSDLDGEDFKQMVNKMLEMFPLSCALEVSHCLTLMSGDMERAAQLIIHRYESGASLQPTDRKMLKGAPKPDMVDDKSVKDRIVGKYGFVDQAEDARYHRPTIKKAEDKKMIRYRDGKIVSTKGERFTQVTKAESEEMKKSYKF